ncbi:MAG: universal stress protein, partial [Flavobacteriales bacterium]
MSIRTIVVPYDFSDCATNALRVAATIARATGACIDVVHAYEQMTDFHPENQKLREDIEARLDKIPELPFVEGLEMKKFMLRHIGLADIFRNERIASADLIVMGSHGASGLRG